MNDTQYIGQHLERARIALGLSTAHVAERLRIRAMFVDALEREEWATIGDFVYVRGFLKNYAKLVGLDPAPLVAQLTAEYAPEVAAPRPALESLAGSGMSTVRITDEATRRWFPWVLGSLTAIAAVLVLMVGFSLWQNVSASRQPALDIAAQGTLPVPAQPSAAQLAQPAPALTDTGDDGQNQNEGVNLRLQLTQPSWLSVAVDGKRVVYETLPAGTVREFHGVREITLRAGNAGGVVAKIDGKDLGALGEAGQVQDRVFAVKPSPEQLKALHE
jgi:cytoskeleton protein RodZ